MGKKRYGRGGGSSFTSTKDWRGGGGKSFSHAEVEGGGAQNDSSL